MSSFLCRRTKISKRGNNRWGKVGDRRGRRYLVERLRHLLQHYLAIGRSLLMTTSSAAAYTSLHIGRSSARREKESSGFLECREYGLRQHASPSTDSGWIPSSKLCAVQLRKIELMWDRSTTRVTPGMKGWDPHILKYSKHWNIYHFNLHQVDQNGLELALGWSHTGVRNTTHCPHNLVWQDLLGRTSRKQSEYPWSRPEHNWLGPARSKTYEAWTRLPR